jgi:hypothetical protein
MKTTLPAMTLLAAAIGAACTGAVAVMPGADGLGQALIFPYYTTQSARGNAFNTYLSIVNHTADGEGGARAGSRKPRLARGGELQPVPEPQRRLGRRHRAARERPRGAPHLRGSLVREPAFGTGRAGQPPGPDLPERLLYGSFNDGNGTGLDRTREGWIEVIEMATLTGASAAAVTHNSTSVPANCAAVQGNAGVDVAAPTAGCRHAHAHQRRERTGLHAQCRGARRPVAAVVLPAADGQLPRLSTPSRSSR